MDETVQTAPCSVSQCPLTLQTGENIIIYRKHEYLMWEWTHAHSTKN